MATTRPAADSQATGTSSTVAAAFGINVCSSRKGTMTLERIWKRRGRADLATILLRWQAVTKTRSGWSDRMSSR